MVAGLPSTGKVRINISYATWNDSTVLTVSYRSKQRPHNMSVWNRLRDFLAHGERKKLSNQCH